MNTPNQPPPPNQKRHSVLFVCTGNLHRSPMAEYFFKAKIGNGVKPTAIAISILDIKQPADWNDGIISSSHWCLAHYLLDGHHKIFAASKTGEPMTLLSFLALGEGVSSSEQNYELLEKLSIVTDDYS